MLDPPEQGVDFAEQEAAELIRDLRRDGYLITQPIVDARVHERLLARRGSIRAGR